MLVLPPFIWHRFSNVKKQMLHNSLSQEEESKWQKKGDINDVNFVKIFYFNE